MAALAPCMRHITTTHTRLMVITRGSISHYLANIVISETHLQVILIPQMLENLGFMVLEYS